MKTAERKVADQVVARWAALSLVELALICMADLVLAVIIFVIFATASWAIRYCIEALDISDAARSFVEFAPVILLCFGTLWCTVFAVEGTHLLAMSVRRKLEN